MTISYCNERICLILEHRYHAWFSEIGSGFRQLQYIYAIWNFVSACENLFELSYGPSKIVSRLVSNHFNCHLLQHYQFLPSCQWQCRVLCIDLISFHRAGKAYFRRKHFHIPIIVQFRWYNQLTLTVSNWSHCFHTCLINSMYLLYPLKLNFFMQFITSTMTSCMLV